MIWREVLSTVLWAMLWAVIDVLTAVLWAVLWTMIDILTAVLSVILPKVNILSTVLWTVLWAILRIVDVLSVLLRTVLCIVGVTLAQLFVMITLGGIVKCTIVISPICHLSDGSGRVCCSQISRHEQLRQRSRYVTDAAAHSRKYTILQQSSINI